MSIIAQSKRITCKPDEQSMAAGKFAPFGGRIGYVLQAPSAAAAADAVLDFKGGVFKVTVDDNEDSAIAVGATLYYHTGQVINNTSTSGTAFAVAMEAVTTSATTAIQIFVY